MLSWLRTRLQLIRYHSASQAQTRWSRAGDAALAMSFVLAVPVTWYCDRTFSRVEAAHTVVGLIQQDVEGRFTVHLSHGESAANQFRVPPEEQWGFFQIEIQHRRRGLPFETSTIARQPRIDFIGKREGGPQPNAQLAADSPVRMALIEALDASSVVDAPIIAASLRSDAPVIKNDWPTWVAASFLWWVCLFVVLSVSLVVARLGTLLFMRGRFQRADALARAGKCPNCGYDLRGLEFSERCPECGQLQE